MLYHAPKSRRSEFGGPLKTREDTMTNCTRCAQLARDLREKAGILDAALTQAEEEEERLAHHFETLMRDGASTHTIEEATADLPRIHWYRKALRGLWEDAA